MHIFSLQLPGADFWVFFRPSYFLLSSLPSPFFLGLEHHNDVNLSVRRELVFVKSCLQGLFLQALMLCLFAQKKIASLFPVDGMLIHWHFLKNRSRALCKFILSRTKNSWHLNPSPHWKQFTKWMLYLWTSWPRHFWELFTSILIGALHEQVIWIFLKTENLARKQKNFWPYVVDRIEPWIAFIVKISYSFFPVL